MIYLDHNATTQVDPEVLKEMLPFFTEKFGNASSRTHSMGFDAAETVEMARQRVASLISASANEIVFTSGATESINLAINGVAQMYGNKGKHIVTVRSEHNAVLDTLGNLEESGFDVTYLPVDHFGQISILDLQNAFRPDTILVAVMWANNETGVIQDVETIANVCQSKNVFFLCDATQAFGKVEIDLAKTPIHLMAFSAHKIYGPKGVGGLFVRQSGPNVKLPPQIHGGGHESGMRSGTLNVPGIVGLGKAAEIAAERMLKDSTSARELRDYLEQQLLSNLDEVFINGIESERMGHTSNLEFRYVNAETLMMRFIRPIAVSSGSACTSASARPSHVLMAMGRSEQQAESSLRLSLGRDTTKEEIDIVIEEIVTAVRDLRSISPIWERHRQNVL